MFAFTDIASRHPALEKLANPSAIPVLSFHFQSLWIKRILCPGTKLSAAEFLEMIETANAALQDVVLGAGWAVKRDGANPNLTINRTEVDEANITALDAAADQQPADASGCIGSNR